jgi:hypothetical protein
MPSPSVVYGQDSSSSSSAQNQGAGSSPGAAASNDAPATITPQGPLDSPGKSYASPSQRGAAGGSAGYTYDDQRVDSSSSDDGKPRKRHNTNPDTAHGATPLTRSIHVQCYGDRIIVVAARDDKRGSRIILLDQHPQVVIEDLFGEVTKRVEGWGIAGRGMYWRPRMVLDIQPGGDARGAELHELLVSGGMDAEIKPTTTGGPGPQFMGRKQ